MRGGGIPRRRVGARGVAADRGGRQAVAAKLQIGDGVEDGSVQAGQNLGDRLLLHEEEDGPDT